MEVVVVISLLIFVSMIFFIKNENTHRQRAKIIIAIGNYLREHVEKDEICLFYSMESYDRTLFRLWDWGYKNIVSKETYDKIKEFL